MKFDNKIKFNILKEANKFLPLQGGINCKESMQLKNIDQKNAVEYFFLLKECGFIEGFDATTSDGKNIFIQRITSNGYDFLEHNSFKNKIKIFFIKFWYIIVIPLSISITQIIIEIFLTNSCN